MLLYQVGQLNSISENWYAAVYKCGPFIQGEKETTWHKFRWRFRKKNYDFGVGVDLATGSPMGKVVEGVVSGVTNAHGATTSYYIERIHTTSELEKALGISVEASGGCGCFGASARFDLAQKSKIQSSSLFLSITATIEVDYHLVNAGDEDGAVSILVTLSDSAGHNTQFSSNLEVIPAKGDITDSHFLVLDASYDTPGQINVTMQVQFSGALNDTSFAECGFFVLG